MSLAKHPMKLLVVIAEASLEKALAQAVKRLGARGYTACEVRGSGSSGDREGAWDADRTLRMEVICSAEVADEIAEHVLTTYGAHFGVTLYFTDVEVLRPKKFSSAS